jgi:rubredoxin
MTHDDIDPDDFPIIEQDDEDECNNNSDCSCGRVKKFDDLTGTWYCPACDDEDIDESGEEKK